MLKLSLSNGRKNQKGGVRFFRLLASVGVVSNKFYSEETEGDFVAFISEGKKIWIESWQTVEWLGRERPA